MCSWTSRWQQAAQPALVLPAPQLLPCHAARVERCGSCACAVVQLAAPDPTCRLLCRYGGYDRSGYAGYDSVSRCCPCSCSSCTPCPALAGHFGRQTALRVLVGCRGCCHVLPVRRCHPGAHWVAAPTPTAVLRWPGRLWLRPGKPSWYWRAVLQAGVVQLAELCRLGACTWRLSSSGCSGLCAPALRPPFSATMSDTRL